MSKLTSVVMLLVLGLAGVLTLFAQSPTGTISGTVTDASGAVVPTATVTVTNKATGIARVLAANANGLYSAPSLQPGDYEVKAEMQGFRTTVREAQVLAGSPTTVDMAAAAGRDPRNRQRGSGFGADQFREQCHRGCH